MNVGGRPSGQESIFLPILPDAGDVHVRAAGKPRAWPLLLFHGAGADVTWRTWEPQMDAFAAVRRVYALDWPGWGQSAGERPGGIDRLAPEPMVQVALRTMDALEIDAADVGGVSWGGLIALELALAAPARVSRLLLVDAAHPPDAVAAGRYGALVQPTWLAWAEEDPILPLTSGQALAASLPHCELHVLGGRTHWPHHLHPEAFNEMAVAFLVGS